MRLIVLFLLLPVVSLAQLPFRIKADFTLKSVTDAGEESITTGTLCYDKNIGQLIYYVAFPEPTTVVLTEDSAMVFQNNQRTSSSENQFPPVGSVFHLALSGTLADFGLSSGGRHELLEMSREQGKVISLWKPLGPAPHAQIALLQANNRLQAVMLYGAGGTVESKQQFSDYSEVEGTAIPTSMLQRSTAGEKGAWTEVKLANIVLDELDAARYRKAGQE